mgnify:CR=1 FL=1
MKKQILTVLSCLFLVHVTYAQFYNNEKVFEFDYSIENNKSIQKGTVYLGCSKTQREELSGQYLIMWTSKIKDLIDNYFSTGLTGVGESKDSIFLHPPRHDSFGILEYSPFPVVYFPLERDKSWKWGVDIGEIWANKLGLSPEKRNYEYEVKDVKSIYLELQSGYIDCYEIHATSISGELKSSFVGLFSLDYGFVKIIYNNVDGSVIRFWLKNIDSWKHYREKADESVFRYF